MGREDDRLAVGRRLRQFPDEDDALGSQGVYHILVVHDLVPHIDGCAIEAERPLDDVDRADDAGAEAARRAQDHPQPWF